MDLGMTVTQLKREMPMSEFMDWVAYYNLIGNSDDGNLLKDDGGEALLKGFGL